MQRLFDIFFSTLAVLVLSPLLIPIMLILRFTGEGEVFYIQPRIGVAEKEFGLIKFATMQKNSPNIGAGEMTLRDDPRILPFGKILRKTKINELPQLINIFIGDMSIVGPRPMVPSTWRKYPILAREELSKIPPGLSGIGSIYFRDEEQFLTNEVDSERFYREVIIPYKCDLELWYMEHRNIGMYFKVIFLTVVTILSPSSSMITRLFQGIPDPPLEIVRKIGL